MARCYVPPVGRSVTDPSHQVLSWGAAIVIGMPQRFSCRAGDGKFVWERAAGKLVQVECGACACAKRGLQEGVWVVQARLFDNCAH